MSLNLAGWGSSFPTLASVTVHLLEIQGKDPEVLVGSCPVGTGNEHILFREMGDLNEGGPGEFEVVLINAGRCQ